MLQKTVLDNPWIWLTEEGLGGRVIQRGCLSVPQKYAHNITRIKINL